MTPEDWQKLQGLFAQATALPASEVAGFLDRECAGHSALRAELESMLRQDQDGGTRIQRAIQTTAQEVKSNDSDPWIGSMVGAYRIVSKIAEGGMGAVYTGERADEHYRQRVAIKILNFGQMSPAVRSRFVDERQILANLHHPNIATLVDGGATDQGIPYLVMEYIDGTVIDKYCNAQRLSIRARLALFVEVCAAVQYAHQSLVVHRDIKPGNILVDDHATPKLLDFGIAKLLDPDALDPAAGSLTRADMRVLTPEFASPEQVRGEKVTTATDVYALGLLLYRLLTGEMPYHFASYSPVDIEHAVCDTKPDRPSEVSELAASGSLQRNLDSSSTRWASQLKGDLDNIILLTLRKEPEQRYGTVQQLADDIQRYLNQRPVLARPTSVAYRARKFIGRHRRAVTSAALMATVIVGLVSYYTLQLARERDRAQLESRKATEVAAFLTGLFKLSDPAEMSGESISARELLDRGARRIQYELAGQPEVQATMTQVIGRNYRNLGHYSEAESLFRHSLEVRRALYGENHADTLASWNDLGLTLVDLGKYDEADDQLRRVIAVREENNTPTRLDLAVNQRSLGIALVKRGEYKAAEQRLLAALQLQRALSPNGSAELASTLSALGHLYVVQGDFPTAESRLNESVTMHIAIHGREHPDTLKTLNELGSQYFGHGEILAARETYNEVLTLRRQLFGDRHISVGRVLGNLGSINYQTGDFETAMQQYVEGLAIFQVALGDEHPKIAVMKENIANVYLATGKQDQAYRMYLESIAQMRRIFGAVHIETGMTTSNMGGALIVMKRYREAQPYLVEADAIFRQTLGDEHPFRASNMLKMGQAEQELQQYSVAESTYQEALVIATKSLAPEHPDILKIQYALGDVMMLQGMFTESVALLKKTLAAWRRIDLEASSHTARTAGLLGDCLTRMQRYDEAEIYLLESHDELATIQESDHEHMVHARERLQRLYLAWGRPEAAQAYL